MKRLTINSKLMIWLGICIVFVCICHSAATYHFITWNSGIRFIEMPMPYAKPWLSRVGWLLYWQTSLCSSSVMGRGPLCMVS